MADPPEVTPTGNKPTEVLAYSPSVQPSHSTLQDPSFTPLANDEIERLIKRHPRGKLFNLDPEGVIASSSDGDEYPATYEVPKATKLTPSKVEAGLLSKHFPGARQVIFLPLWDSSASRFSTFFAYTTSEFRTFSNNPDFLHCIAFCNCVMTEITRLATTAADQQKSDFIGSVSHELRSPLHGILASCEFLGDTETSSFQKSLIDTADSCARTLLDTINMVLDYSKINAFERNATKARRKKGQVGTGTMESSGQPQLNIYGDVDLAAITEEVVEGVATGQVFKDSLTGVDAIDLTSDVSKQSVPGKKDVEIILDISPRASPKDWVFITQPGAFRRIIMNIFGNSLKYTRQGFIRVKLEAQSPAKHKGDARDPPPATIVRLTITDTGQGMSPQFMRTKLYTPFAQENSIAPGTGLGLSLVKSMVTMLNGEINIHSAVGIGTEVTVKFPMTLSGHTAPGGSSSGTSGSTPSSAGSIERIKDESLQIVQLKAQGKKAMLFPDKSAQKSLSESARMIRDAINRYLTGWFGFEVTYPLSRTNLPDIIITDEADLPELLNVLPNALTGDRGPMVIVLCTATSRRSNAYMISKSERFEAVSHPFGPYKLAKTIRVCLDRLERIAIMESESEGMGLTPIAPSEEDDFDAAEVAIAVQQMTISNPDPDIPDVTVIKAGTVVAHGDSIHAQLLSDNEPTSMSGGSQEAPEYPFPAEDGTISPSNLQTVETERPQLASRRTISPTTTEIANTARIPEPATPVSSKGALANDLPTKLAEPLANAPRMLLVDDNSVNLRLLQTFMKKRKYNDIFSAEDGQQAVSVYRNLLTSSPPRPPDIIFMDISMPVMNGFEATRRIREIEADFRAQFPSPMVTPPSALIIALTGLASGRDQSEAFTSGFDLYLVKPISFREVGRLLDNWEKSGGGASVGVPHGPAVAPVEGKENMPGAGAGGDLMDLPPA
jgi:signal transduction histidine kinase/CheY-like chemotaxis protein